MRKRREDGDVGPEDHDHGPRPAPFQARRPGQGSAPSPVLSPGPVPSPAPACSQGRAHPGAACGCGRDHADPDWADYGKDRDEAAPAPPPVDLNFDRGPAEDGNSDAPRDPIAGADVGAGSNARARNDGFAAVNRRMLRALGVLAVRLASAPGAGKSTLLARTVEALAARPASRRVAVIEADPRAAEAPDRTRPDSTRPADAPPDVPALRIVTGPDRDLDAQMIQLALGRLPLSPGAILFIEDADAPARRPPLDLGETAAVALLSVAEGEAAALKRPERFAGARLAILCKTDLAPHCDVDLDRCEADLRRAAPGIKVLRLSARTGEGMEAWLDWLAAAAAENEAEAEAAAPGSAPPPQTGPK
ncbi:hydrogenase accessory protein HypB [Albimonas donghaensis]|uniref:Hydrogenase accessory protein HypB n=1 Tax=Albimonas donghaensis TaxID=356660 RepID=A0A1H3ABZ7_9RHOB|nr:hydrogenase nickel incorporation protein HypB [Albimonas donghaensis]SDX27095.1 hydrogenase accessory protein HypB [Albimonas donghaensis]